MKKTFSAIVIVVLAASVVFFYSCKKKDATTQAQLDAQTEQFNTDQNNIKSESDQADNDINTTVSGSSTLNGRVEGVQNFVCGVSIDSSSFQTGGKVLVFKFDSVTSCLSPSRMRSGKIKVELVNKPSWGQQGATLVITYENYKVLYQRTNTSLTFNGIKTLTNVNGNDWLGFLFAGKALMYRERAFNINVTFDNGSTAIWNSARTTTWTYSNASGSIPAKINFSSNGDTTLNSYSNVGSWGTTRFGKAFTINYNSPIISNTYCGLWRFLSGELVDHINGSDYTLTVGVNTDGSPITNYDDCAYGFKVSWVDVNGKAETAVFSY